MVKRASIFEDNDLDLTGFAPKEGRDTKSAPGRSRQASCGSREFPQSRANGQKGVGAQRKIKGYRTGRNVQFNVKATQETLNTFHLICERKGWLLAEGFAQAVEALKRVME